ncbi:hypothetical protein NX059_006660 [Plenodomus lindquistii]|nr:hypothetical protein NX059_006660 [Plenodomus lindquistii]
MDTKEKEQLAANVKLMTDLKPLIIAEARAIFSYDKTTGGLSGHTYDVVIHRLYDPRGRIHVYSARLIIYDNPASSQWTLLMKGKSYVASAADAMSRLLEELYERSYERRSKEIYGWTLLMSP